MSRLKMGDTQNLCNVRQEVNGRVEGYHVRVLFAYDKLRILRRWAALRAISLNSGASNLLRVLGFGLFQDGDFGIGGFPNPKCL